MYANNLNGKDAAKELTTGRLRDVRVNRLRNIQTGVASNYEFTDDKWCIGSNSIYDYGEELIKVLLGAMLSVDTRNGYKYSICNKLVSKTLKYCPKCMKYGSHYMFQQFSFIDKCLIHNIKLKSTCEVCNQEIPYSLEFAKDTHAYQCKHCKSLLFNNDDFGTLIDEWNINRIKSDALHPFEDIKAIPIILTNDFSNCIESKIV